MKINHGDHHLPLHWLHILHCIIFIRGHEHNTLGSKKVGLVFLPCEVSPFSNVLSVLITHVIKFGLNPLINSPGSLLTLNVCDVIFIWANNMEREVAHELFLVLERLTPKRTTLPRSPVSHTGRRSVVVPACTVCWDGTAHVSKHCSCAYQVQSIGR
jgi:hypothetical protein